MYTIALPRSPLRMLGHLLAVICPVTLGVAILVQAAFAHATAPALWANRVALGVAFANLGLTYTLVFVLRHSVERPLVERAGTATALSVERTLARAQMSAPRTSLTVLIFPIAALALLLLAPPTFPRIFVAYTCLTVGIAANVLAFVMAPHADHLSEFAGQMEIPDAHEPTGWAATQAALIAPPAPAHQTGAPAPGHQTGAPLPIQQTGAPPVQVHQTAPPAPAHQTGAPPVQVHQTGAPAPVHQTGAPSTPPDPGQGAL